MFILRINDELVNIVYGLNIKTLEKSNGKNAFSFNQAITELTIAKDGLVARFPVDGEKNLVDMENCVSYDFRDTTLWTLEKLYEYF